MKIEATINYMEEYLPPRCRKPRYREVEETVSRTIREASYEEAPLAFRLEDCGGWREIRAFNGKLYERCKTGANCENPAWWHLDTLLNWCSRCGCLSYELDKSKAKVLKELHKRISRYLIINGDEVWEVSGEPAYQICTFGLGHNHASTNLMHTSLRRVRTLPSNCYNALEFDKAVEAAKKTAIARGDTNSVDKIGNFWHIEIIMPEMVKLPCHKDAKVKKTGDFKETAEAIIRGTDSALEAGLLVMAAAMAKD